jgi:hypothetical protein
MCRIRVKRDAAFACIAFAEKNPPILHCTIGKVALERDVRKVMWSCLVYCPPMPGIRRRRSPLLSMHRSNGVVGACVDKMDVRADAPGMSRLIAAHAKAHIGSLIRLRAV